MQQARNQRVREDDKTAAREATQTPGECLLADLCGPFPTAVHGEDTLLVVWDVHSGRLGLYPLIGKHSAGVKCCIVHFLDRLKKMREANGLPPPEYWKLKSDQGGEFEGATITKMLGDHTGPSGVGFSEFVPKGRHVSRIEQIIRKSVEAIRSLLSAAGLP